MSSCLENTSLGEGLQTTAVNIFLRRNPQVDKRFKGVIRCQFIFLGVIRCRVIRCRFIFSGKNDELTPDFPPNDRSGFNADDLSRVKPSGAGVNLTADSRLYTILQTEKYANLHT